MLSAEVDEIVLETSPPLPPIPKKRSGGDDSRLHAILTHDGKEYQVECLSRKYIAKFRFQDSELGNVIYDEDGVILEYSQKELAPDIYRKLRVFIKCWKRSFPNF
jgi:hypothetical protein